MANPNPKVGHDTRIKPGEKRNPRGIQGPRLKKILETQAEELLTTAKGHILTRAEAICHVAWKLAMEGSLDAVKFIFDRIEGKVTDRVEMSGRDGAPMPIEIIYVHDWRLAGSEPEPSEN